MTIDQRGRAPLACWSVTTPAAPGPIAIIQIEGDVDEALRRLSVRPVHVGAVVVRSLAGVDAGIVARWTDSCAHLMPHGGRAVVRAVLASLERAGLRHARSTTWPEAADLVESRMLDALARAPSPLAIDLLLDQPRRWSAHVLCIRDEYARMLDRLLRPPLVVATGASNIGKSTLINALAGRHVSIVADEPATTRDHVGVQLNLAGLVVRYVDTPGVLHTKTALDSEARAIADRLRDHADLLLRCADHANAPLPAPAGFAGRVLTVALRVDIAPPAFERDVDLVAPEGRGLADLAEAIRDSLVMPQALADPGAWRFWEAARPAPGQTPARC